MSYTEAAGGFKVGDLVFVGPPARLDQKNTWRILSLNQAADGLVYATLSSGLTGRIWTKSTQHLSHFRAVEVAE
jgi:hypothetical protein